MTCPPHKPALTLKAGQVLTFLFVVGDVFQQLSLHAAVFPWLSLTQHCSLWWGRKKKQNRNIRVELRHTHTVHSKEETIMDTSCLQHGQTSLCKIKAARKLPPRHRSQIKHGRADSPRSTGGSRLCPGLAPPSSGWDEARQISPVRRARECC